MLELKAFRSLNVFVIKYQYQYSGNFNDFQYEYVFSDTNWSLDFTLLKQSFHPMFWVILLDYVR
jgi:hypothetical protein